MIHWKFSDKVNSWTGSVPVCVGRSLYFVVSENRFFITLSFFDEKESWGITAKSEILEVSWISIEDGIGVSEGEDGGEEEDEFADHIVII